MSQITLTSGRTIEYAYDDVIDMLFIRFSDARSFSHYGEIDEMPGAMLAYNQQDQFIGLAFEGVERRLRDASPETLERLAATLVERFTPSPAT